MGGEGQASQEEGDEEVVEAQQESAPLTSLSDE